MDKPLLSVVVPVYNESQTIEEILQRIDGVAIEKEIIVIDNCSTDATQAVLERIEKESRIKVLRVIYHSFNKGKGDSVREGINEAMGEYVVIQDADLEYDPKDYTKLIKPLLEKKADMSLGARFTYGHSGILLHRLGNRLLTGLLNVLFFSRLNDYATCYKMAPKGVFLNLGLNSNSFDIEVEIVCKALKNNLRISEVPIAYYPRSYGEGKKIRWYDGIQAVISIFKYRFIRI